MTITLYKPRTADERLFLDLIGRALDNGLTLPAIENVLNAMQDPDTAARLAALRDAETDPALKAWYQLGINQRIGGGQ